MKRGRGQWKSRRPWTVEEEHHLVELAKGTRKEAAEQLNRSICSIEAKARKLKLSFPRQSYQRPTDTVRPWTEKEKQLLRDSAGTRTIQDVAQDLNRTRWAVVDQARHLKITWVDQYKMCEVVFILRVAETTVRRHKNKLNQRWRTFTSNNQSIMYGATKEDIQALARSLLDNAGNIGAPYQYLVRVSKGEWDIPGRKV